jgi:hypothetical protein
MRTTCPSLPSARRPPRHTAPATHTHAAPAATCSLLPSIATVISPPAPPRHTPTHPPDRCHHSRAMHRRHTHSLRSLQQSTRTHRPYPQCRRAPRPQRGVAGCTLRPFRRRSRRCWRILLPLCLITLRGGVTQGLVLLSRRRRRGRGAGVECQPLHQVQIHEQIQSQGPSSTRPRKVCRPRPATFLQQRLLPCCRHPPPRLSPRRHGQ